MAWNYRVVRTDFLFDGKVNPVFSIHRCVYPGMPKPDDIPEKFGVQEASPEGETVNELRADLQRMLEALDKPILVGGKTGKLKAAEK